ncbi:IS630 family transposase [Limobrevibacterium gyesilva]|uniref:IS630 family transposase n=1 Tax=Limobrevibacterium gyesilva TaxID=2991712 RepID=UPI0038D0468E
MTVEITRTEHSSADLRRSAARSSDARASRRMPAIALLLEGCGRGEAAEQCGMDRQTLRDWVHRYNAEGLPGLSNRPHAGAPPRKLNPAQEAAVAAWVRDGSTVEEDGVVRWRLVDLRARIATHFDVHLHERSVGKLLHRLGFRRVSVRPRHPQIDLAAQEAHKKNFADLVAAAIPEHARGKPVELWWQDEARVGQQGSLTYVWADRGSRPPAPRDQRYGWAYIFGAVCPQRGVGAALVLPHANTDAMNLHLAEISSQVAADARAVLILYGARWHQTGDRLRLPANISLLPLPPYSPQLNPIENIWQFLRRNYLSNCVFDTYAAIVDACCSAWNALVAHPDRIRSIASRAWAQAVSA